MNKIFTTLAIASLITLCATSTNAMESTTTVKYSLAHVIYQKVYPDMVTFVKKISDNHLVVFNRKGIGELWDITNNSMYSPTFVKEFSGVDIFAFENAFTYLDCDKKLLFIGFDDWRDKLYIYNLDDNDLPFYPLESLHVGHPLHLYQKTNGMLIMQNTNDGSAKSIYPRWQDAKNRDTVLFESSPIQDASNVRVRNEGLIVSAHKFQQNRKKWALPDDLFDIESLTDDERKQIGWHRFECVSYDSKCYHKTLNGELYCGHDGFVTIWKQKTTT